MGHRGFGHGHQAHLLLELVPVAHVGDPLEAAGIRERAALHPVLLTAEPCAALRWQPAPSFDT